MRVTVTVEMKKIPEKCGECRFYSEPEYRCHSERGNEAHCALGYMHGDLRDQSYRDSLYPDCQLGEDVIINNDNHNESIH
jgi:hypothetical protein